MTLSPNLSQLRSAGVMRVPVPGPEGPEGPEGPVGPAGPGGSDADVATYIATPGTQTEAALSATIAAATVVYAVPGLDEDGTPIVGNAGTEIRVLTPEVAASDFAPVTEALWLPARLFDPADGAASTWGAADGKGWGWLLDDTIVEGVTAVLTVPSHWTQLIEIDVWWAPLTAVDGNTVWQAAVYNLSDNNSLTSSGSSLTTLATDGAGTAAYRTRVAVSGALTLAVDTAKLQRLLVRRNASSASDTYAGDVVFMGVRIVGA